MFISIVPCHMIEDSVLNPYLVSAFLPVLTYLSTNASPRLTIIGIVRCIYFWRTRAMSNPTINLMPLAYWSCIETLVAIICACLPDSRFFFSSLVPKFYKSVASSYKVSTPSSYSTLSGSSKPSSRQAGKVAKDDLEKIELETDITSITVTTTKSSV